MSDILNINNVSRETMGKLKAYEKLVLEWNNKFNLTSIIDDKGIEIKHFEDSLVNESYFFKNANVAEVGSGGGFPSIPIMCLRNDLKFTLFESVNKKCTFLQEVIKQLTLNAQVINVRAEDAGKNPIYREKFDIVTARAVARLNTLSEYTIPLIKKGGIFIAYKGEKNGEEIEAKNAIKTLGGELIKSDFYNLSLDMGERSVFIIKKVEKTPEKYPRGNGKERSKPL